MLWLNVGHECALRCLLYTQLDERLRGDICESYLPDLCLSVCKSRAPIQIRRPAITTHAHQDLMKTSNTPIIRDPPHLPIRDAPWAGYGYRIHALGCNSSSQALRWPPVFPLTAIVPNHRKGLATRSLSFHASLASLPAAGTLLLQTSPPSSVPTTPSLRLLVDHHPKRSIHRSHSGDKPLLQRAPFDR